MKRKNGFSLAELLGVITLLGILALIVIPVIDRSMKEGKDDIYASQIKSIEASARMWGTDHISELPGETEIKFISLSRLLQDGYIEKIPENPKTGKAFSAELQIKITKQNASYRYEVIEE